MKLKNLASLVRSCWSLSLTNGKHLGSNEWRNAKPVLKSVRMRRSYSPKKMVAEESQRQYETQKTEEERKFVLEQLQRQLQARELEHKLKMEEVERREAEADNSLLREEQTLERQAKIEETKLRQMELSQKGSAKPVRDGGSKAPKLPRFDESKDNIDVYLIRFERYAKARGWPATEWAVYLSTLLSGKADEVYYALSEEQAGEYHELKKAILIRYELHEAGFRKKFKTAKPDVGESGAQFAHRLISYFQRWSELAGAENNVDSIKDLILRDQFLYSIPMEVAMFLRERQPKNMSVTTLRSRGLQKEPGTVLQLVTNGSFSHQLKCLEIYFVWRPQLINIHAERVT